MSDRASRPRPKRLLVAVRLNPDEYALARRHAQAWGLTMPALLRQALREHLDEVARPYAPGAVALR